MADSSKPSVRRRGPGRPFEPGQSGNPGGKSAEREELRRWLREEFGRDSIEGIAAMAGLVPGRAAAKGRVRLDAYCWLANQSIGKAVQAISGPDGRPLNLLDFSGLTNEQLRQLEAIRAALKVKP